MSGRISYARSYKKPPRVFLALILALGVLGLFYTIYPSSSLNDETSSSATNNAADKVKIQVYYETHCPDSKEFILSQFYPTYQAIPDAIEAELVPYGKARTTKLPDGSFQFQCQHGVNECQGNTIQACALDKVTDEAKVFQYINCMEDRIVLGRPPQNAAQSCATTVGVDYSVLNTCATSAEGQALLAKMGDKTNSLQPKLHFVPWIVINGVYSAANQQRALSDLKGLVCDNYKNCPSHLSPGNSASNISGVQSWTPIVSLLLSVLIHALLNWSRSSNY